MIRQLSVKTSGQRLHEITREIESVVQFAEIEEGLCTIFVQHTSASLTIQENADPSAKHDLEHWMNKLVPEGDPDFTHTLEGRDDMPSHIKCALTATSLAVPVVGGQLALGTWQGIYLWEHRRSAHSRSVMIHIGE
ncbi:secondary thiamine-phosphate synthase enzyme YjbQ [Oligoflexia bacterium]|nr:secondary thiamine-phosphate synthase enzyme YjbQ [Oligoflexia bacterium]